MTTGVVHRYIADLVKVRHAPVRYDHAASRYLDLDNDVFYPKDRVWDYKKNAQEANDPATAEEVLLAMAVEVVAAAPGEFSFDGLVDHLLAPRRAPLISTPARDARLRALPHHHALRTADMTMVHVRPRLERVIREAVAKEGFIEVGIWRSLYPAGHHYPCDVWDVRKREFAARGLTRRAAELEMVRLAKANGSRYQVVADHQTLDSYYPYGQD
jgi:hypothetical protein